MRCTKGPTVVLSNRQKTLRLDGAAVRRVVQETLNAQGSRRDAQLGELSLVFVTDDEIAQLNRQFLDHQGPTDVITFEHGEIVISTERAIAQAREFGSPIHEELTRYIIHGLLHLAGYDDATPALRRRMHRRQEQILDAARKKLDLTRILR